MVFNDRLESEEDEAEASEWLDDSFKKCSCPHNQIKQNETTDAGILAAIEEVEANGLPVYQRGGGKV